MGMRGGLNMVLDTEMCQHGRSFNDFHLKFSRANNLMATSSFESYIANSSCVSLGN